MAKAQSVAFAMANEPLCLETQLFLNPPTLQPYITKHPKLSTASSLLPESEAQEERPRATLR